MINNEENWLPPYSSTPSISQRPPPPYFNSSTTEVCQVSLPPSASLPPPAIST
ncbi:hypothetical protein CONCODRAFT_76577, partial [Conidiobolus coronatus NRRL 28638]